MDNNNYKKNQTMKGLKCFMSLLNFDGNIFPSTSCFTCGFMVIGESCFLNKKERSP